MKIRNGFVSNSSSSSFCIYGTSVEHDEVLALMKKLDMEFDEEESYLDTWEIDKVLEKAGYMVRMENMMGDYYWIGCSYDNIPDDMTGKEFKKKTEKEVKELTGKENKLGTCSEAWRDG